METFSWPEHPEIDLAELDGLTLDAESARRFDRRFLGESLLAWGWIIVAVVVCLVLEHLGRLTLGVVGAAMVTALVLSFTLGLRKDRRMMTARPVSARSGQEMTPFIVREAQRENHYELAYVDRSSGTYFRKRFTPDHG